MAIHFITSSYIAICYCFVVSLPVLSVIIPTALSLPLLTWGLLLVNIKLILNLSVPSTILSHITGMLMFLLISPAKNVALKLLIVVLELRFTSDPV